MSSRIIRHFYDKMSPLLMLLCCIHQVGTAPFSWTFFGKLLDGRKTYTTAKNFLISPIRKIWIVPLTWQKHWMVKALPNKISILSTFQCYVKKATSLNACFLLFNTTFLISNFIKFQQKPLQLGFRSLWANQT